ncbi:MAG: tryptophan-rich sensory protein [Agathobacter sp.]|nr:tryptophan-rich sensory protein [Agathobacter sp.]
MKVNKRLLFICIAIPLIVGGVSALLTQNSMEVFESVVQPPLSPPAWLFPVVWTILYVLMGISSYLILTSDTSREEKDQAIRLYAYQLLVNFLWPTFFFNFKWYFFSILWLILLWVLVFLMIRKFLSINRVAGYINIPYLVWLTFALYLNIGIWWLNR